MELPGRRKRSQRRFVDAVKADMQRVDVAEEDLRDRVRWL